MSGKMDNEQRLNVAMSRARDRVCLFRSVGLEDVRADSLSGRLIAHFKQPFANASSGLLDPRSLCESEFEREMYDELTARGYRALPQFPCGGFRMDFVVEGPDGSRVALECDGDRHHGADAWIDDMRRQRVLERAGWVFWRCFASSFVREKEDVLHGLELFFAKNGVRPMQPGDQEPDAALVEFRIVSPMVEQPLKLA